MADESTTKGKTPARGRVALWVFVVSAAALGLLMVRLSCGLASNATTAAIDAGPTKVKASPWRGRRIGTGVDALAAMRRSLQEQHGSAIGLFVFDDVDPIGQLRLEGRVVDANGKGVGGIDVFISGVPRRTTLTEPDGSFYFDELIPQLYRLYARGDAGSAGPLWFQLTERTESITLVLQAGGELVFWVKTTQGAPVANATVALSAYEALLGADSPAFEIAALTDATGQAMFSRLPHVTIRYTVSADGYASSGFDFTRVPALRHEIDVVIDPAALVHGLVLQADGVPVADACVKRWPDVPCQATTDAAGTFSIAPEVNRTKYAYLFFVTHPQWGWGYPAKPEGKGTTSEPYVVRLPPYRRVSGVVLQSGGEPVANALVRLGIQPVEHPDSTMPVGGVVASDEQGQFTLLVPSKVGCTLIAFNGEYTSTAVKIDASDEAPAPVELRMLDGATSAIRGRVFLASGEPAEGAQISSRLAYVQRTTEDASVLRGPATALTDAEGVFQLTGLEAEKYELTAWDASSTGRRHPSARVIAVAGATNVEIRLPAWGSVIATAHQANGLPVAKSVMLILTSTSTTPRRTPGISTKNSEGKVRLDGVAVGTYEAQLVSAGPITATFPVVVTRAGEVVDTGVHVLESKD
ncbi:MAG: carboxypeptidase regulatory-like domain-containing protein [Myxococcales bacterium]|nr:carboxypeptidase regulatory-like domain-containing protein [Myxococcales bacterium]